MKRVLVVEDYQSLSEVYKTAFTFAKAHADAVNRAEDALEMLKKHSYDVMLLDLLLQEMSGLEFLTEHQIAKNYPNMKIYVVSNLTNADLMKEVMQMGARKYFVKAEHTPKEIVDSILNESE